MSRSMGDAGSSGRPEGRGRPRRLDVRGRLLPGVLLVCSALLMGCHHRVSSALPEAPSPPPSAEAVTSSLERVQTLRSLQGSFKLKLTRDTKADKLTGGLVVGSTPDGERGLRVELYTILGPPVGYGVLSAQELSLYLPYSKNSFYHTAEPDALLAGLSGGALGVDALLGALLGQVPRCRVEGDIGWDQALGRWTVPCAEQAGMKVALLLEPGTLRVAGLQGTRTLPTEAPAASDSSPVGTDPAEGSPSASFRLRMEAPVQVDGATLATQIQLVVGTDFSLELEFAAAELAVNQPLEPALFHLDPPEGSHQLPFEALLPAP